MLEKSSDEGVQRSDYLGHTTDRTVKEMKDFIK